MFTQHDLRRLLETAATPKVSIFLPTHLGGREIRQDPIRLKNLINDAEGQLTERGMRAEEARVVLAPARALLDDGSFWRHQDHGLAVFLAPDVSVIHKLPVEVRETAVVGPQFHVRPLIRLLAVDGRFLVLTITNARARLFEATRYAIAERADFAAPAGIEEVAQETEFASGRYAAPTGRPRAGTPGGVPETQGFGETPEELRKTEQVEYLRRVAAALRAALKDDPAPVVVAAEPQARGHFLKLPHRNNVLDDGLSLNPDAFEAEELRRLAFEHVHFFFASARAGALATFNTLLGNGDARAALVPEEIVKGARFARVELLFLAEGARLWGRFDEAADRVDIHGTPTPDDAELLDQAAADTLLHGGRVDLLPREEMPRGALAAAIMRY